MRGNRKLDWLVGYQAVVYAAGLLLATGIVTQWGAWYSRSTAYRSQTDAFFHGRLAVSEDVRDLRFDDTWSQQGVNQVWGLGVPLWRFPFEVLARLSGWEAFPDRVAFGLFALLVGCVVLKVWIGDLDGGPTEDRLNEVGAPANKVVAPSRSSGWQLGSRFGASFLVLLLFPPFFTLLRTRGAVWEEAVAYEYLFAILQLSLLMAFVRQPNARRLWLLCGLAGAGGLIRPTLVFYGFGTLAIAVGVWGLSRGGKTASPRATGGKTTVGKSQKWRATLVPALLGVFIFCLGGGVLWLTNLKRFGNGFEFGHELNVQHFSGSMYATRFDDPFQDEPIAGAAKELFGALFLANRLSGTNLYQKDLFPGQSPTPRLRELYFRTFDWTYLPLVLLGWWAAMAALPGIWRLKMGRGNGSPRLPSSDQTVSLGAGPWSLMAAIPLLGFYLYTPVISSRYMIDLAPAFATAIASGWLWLGSCCQRSWSRVLLCLGLCGWLGVEYHLSTSSSTYGELVSLTWAELEAVRNPRTTAREGSPLRSGRDDVGDGGSGIPFDRVGWDQDTGAVQPLVILFVKDPAFLELELETQDHPRIKAHPQDIRAKVGLESLERERMTRTDRGWRIRFAGPRQRRWQMGLQSAFVATVPKEFLAERATPWVLKSVSWSGEEKKNLRDRRASTVKAPETSTTPPTR